MVVSAKDDVKNFDQRERLGILTDPDPTHLDSGGSTQSDAVGVGVVPLQTDRGCCFMRSPEEKNEHV